MRKRSILLAVSLLGFVLYLPTLRNGYVLDDVPVVELNPTIRQGLFWNALSEPYWPSYGDPAGEGPAPNWRPLASLSFAVTHAIAPGSAVVWDHLANALLHGLLVLALYPLARRFAGAGWPAFFACALFAIHPAHTESVAPVVGRTDLLAAVGFLAALGLFVRYRETGSRSTWHLAAATLFYLLALGGKEAAAPLLLLLPCADILLFGKTPRMLLHKAWRAYLPFLAALGVYLVLRSLVLGQASFVHAAAADLGWFDRLAFAGRNSVVSLGLLLLPVQFHHMLTTLPSDAPLTYPLPTGLPAALWIAAGSIVWLGWLPLLRRRPLPAFLWLGALLPWLPTSGLFPAGAGVALRFLLLPSAFFSCALVYAAVQLARARPGSLRALQAGLAVLVVAGMALSLSRTAMWKNDGTLYRQILADFPGCYTAQYGLSAWLLSEDPPDVAGAIDHARKAVAIAGSHPVSVAGRLSLAVAYEYGTSGVRYAEGAQLEKASVIYRQVVEEHPERWDIHFILTIVLEKQDRLVDALPHLEAVLRLRPDLPMRPWVLLKSAWGHGRLGSTDRAVELLELLISEFPASAEANEARAQLRRLEPQE